MTPGLEGRASRPAADVVPGWPAALHRWLGGALLSQPVLTQGLSKMSDSDAALVARTLAGDL
ncbi:MAG TPA: hypothetical protein VFT28_04335, partial [Gemmatimonadales bacterium]|nr:hypothetical protein [Gemmatimonadales bacterium]